MVLICLFMSIFVYQGEVSASFLQDTKTNYEAGYRDFKDTSDLVSPLELVGLHHGQFDDYGMSFGERKKRSVFKLLRSGVAILKGKRARQKLLDGLLPVVRYKWISFYEKYGSDVKRDFQSVKPTRVRDFMVNGEKVGEIGNIGDGTITYTTRSKNPPRKARISMARPDAKGERQLDVITYY